MDNFVYFQLAKTNEQRARCFTSARFLLQTKNAASSAKFQTLQSRKKNRTDPCSILCSNSFQELNDVFILPLCHRFDK